jgi:hypothetical protein
VRRELAELLGKVALAGVCGYVKMVVDGGVWERIGSAVAVHSIRRQDRISQLMAQIGSCVTNAQSQDLAWLRQK